MSNCIRLKSLLALLAASATLSIVNAEVAAQPKPLQISMAKSFLHDQPQIFIDIAVSEFKVVMKNTTTLDGDLLTKDSAMDVAEKLNEKQLDFGILHAHEFAWAQKKYPDLRPLLIAATKNPDKRANLIVNQKSPAKTIADLRGKKLDMPLRTKEYCRIFVDKLCAEQGKGGPEKFFGSIVKSGSQTAALDAVARGDADATVIDTIWLDFYKEVKGPVFAKHLKVLQQSEVVPPAVIVYKQGVLAQAVVDKVQRGLAKAHKDSRGSALMMLWHIDAFEPIPKDYRKRLEKVLKEYPAPASRH